MAASADPDPAGEPTLGPVDGEDAEVDIVAMEVGRRTAEAQALADAGDYDGAIALWSHLMTTIPRTAAYAPRRASLLLAIVDAHERAYAAEHDPSRLRVAIDLLDRYLGELDPTDDENRIAVEGRRRALAARLDLAVAGAAEEPPPRRGPDEVAGPDPRVAGRRWTIAGGSLLGAGVLGFAVMGMGMILGELADRDLGKARDLSIFDPNKQSAVEAATEAGYRANDLAYAGGVVGGVLTIVGAVAVIRGRRLRLSGGPTALGIGVVGRF
ncbi:MAG: hypothetical protein R3B09_09925 [Nannocystaceae bacterium]